MGEVVLEPVDDHPLDRRSREARDEHHDRRTARPGTDARHSRCSPARVSRAAVAHGERATGGVVRAGGRRTAADAARRAVGDRRRWWCSTSRRSRCAATTPRTRSTRPRSSSSAAAGACCASTPTTTSRAQLGTCTHAVVVGAGRGRAGRAPVTPLTGRTGVRCDPHPAGDLPLCGERCPRPARARAPGPGRPATVGSASWCVALLRRGALVRGRLAAVAGVRRHPGRAAGRERGVPGRAVRADAAVAGRRAGARRGLGRVHRRRPDRRDAHRRRCAAAGRWPCRWPC